jgi:hypothetical protein
MNTQKSLLYWGMENDMAIPQDDRQYQEENRETYLQQWLRETKELVKKLNKQMYEPTI